MTSEVHKFFHEQQRNWSVLLKLRSVIAAIAVCVAMYSGTEPILGAAPQQNLSGTNAAPVSHAPTRLVQCLIHSALCGELVELQAARGIKLNT